MRRLLITFAIIIVATIDGAAKDWRGLLPLHSTRADVENLLGPPKPASEDEPDKPNNFRWTYLLDEAEIEILFADRKYLALDRCDASIRTGTILVIYVTPRTAITLSSLNLDQKKLRKFNPSTDFQTPHEAFVNEEEGLVIRTLDGNVETMVYVASAEDRPRCQSYYDDLKYFVRTGVREGCRRRFDEYGDIRFEDEKARLDNFAIQLLNEPEATGYIIVYAGRKAVVAEAQLRGNRAKNYLVNVRKISPERLKVIDGGHYEDLSVQLSIAPAGSEPPPVMPTVDPKDVEILYEKKQRRPHP